MYANIPPPVNLYQQFHGKSFYFYTHAHRLILKVNDTSCKIIVLKKKIWRGIFDKIYPYKCLLIFYVNITLISRFQFLIFRIIIYIYYSNFKNL